MTALKNVFLSLRSRRFLLRQLIGRDFKVKYRRSVLGVAWSLLYPLLTMGVMAVVFSRMFRVSVPGVSYPAYLLTGIVFFNYFSEASNLAMSSVLSNAGLIGKVYLPKYVFPLSKCLFVGINFLLTLIPLYAVLLLSGTGVNPWHLLLPYPALCLFFFTLGVGLLLSTAAVFLRDTLYIYGVLLTLWTYATPLFWDLSMIGSPFFRRLLRFNPLFQFIHFARTVTLHAACPSPANFAGCFLSAAAALCLGAAVFRRWQDRFAYYL
ncbi:MAG: ABC transporter permease [Oscillospiraceae bacterium]|nr:ABC transporter permease [Oscillospiraceae bacterium]